MELSGKVAVITGGSSGLGLALARTAIEEGMAVAISGSDGGKLDAAATGLRASGGEIFARVADVANEEAIDAFAAAARAWRGRVDLLCCNAGVNCLRPIVEMTMADWEFVVSTNLGGTFNTLRAFVPQMLRQAHQPHILFTGSMACVTAPSVHGLSPYIASKMGILGLSLALENEHPLAELGQTMAFVGSAESDMSASALRRRPGRSMARPSDRSRGVTRISAEAASRMMIDGVKEDVRFLATHPELLPEVEKTWHALQEAFRRPGP